MVYRFRDGVRLAGSAQVVGETLEDVRRRNGGRLTAASVLSDARRRRSPLHRYFEWNDQAAAKEYRLAQARLLIRAVVVVSGPEDEQQFAPVRAFVMCGEAEERPRSFTHVCEAMRDEELREQVLSRARDELLVWRKRYEALREFARVHEAIDEMVVTIS